MTHCVPWINRASPSPGWITANWEVARKRRYFPRVHDPTATLATDTYGLCRVAHGGVHSQFRVWLTARTSRGNRLPECRCRARSAENRRALLQNQVLRGDLFAGFP